MRKPVLLLCALAIFTTVSTAAPGQGSPSRQLQANLSQISPDLAIVTEVSLDSPYMGQQFSILYKLRAQRPPAAVDIEPQQYSGFWTELIPIAPESAASARTVKGQIAVDYLLRQVIAYPLFEGNQKLPSLSLKVKRAGNNSGKPDDWDLLGASAPIEMNILPLPPTSLSGAEAPLVGTVTGSMSRAGGERLAVVLEIEGTANLALFKPLDWLRPASGLQIHAQLISFDKQPQTVEMGGRRQLSLMQRQRWLLSAPEQQSGWSVDGMFLPVFEPGTKVWESVRIEGLSVATRGPSPREAGTGSPAGRFPVMRARQYATVVVFFCVLGIAAVVSVIFHFRKKRAKSDLRGQASIAALEKKLRTSPRAFIDGAHKVLMRCAVEMHREHNLGAEDALLDRCWITVEKHRFTVEPVTAEMCQEMLQSVRQLLLSLPGLK